MVPRTNASNRAPHLLRPALLYDTVATVPLFVYIDQVPLYFHLA